MVWRIFIIEAFHLLLLLFLVDFVTISLSTDNQRWSSTPESWDVLRLVRLAVFLGVLVVGESLGLLVYALNVLGLRDDIDSLHTLVFATLYFFGMFTIFVVREKQSWCWSSRPSWTFMLVSMADAIIVVFLCTFGLPAPFTLKAIPIWQTFIVIAWAAASALVNDVLKVFVHRICDFPLLVSRKNVID